MKTLLVLAGILVIVLACNPTNENSENSSNPGSAMTMAEVSGLAKLMKQMHKDAKGWRNALIEGEMVSAEAEIYSKLTESTPTNKNVQGPAFEGFSKNYEVQLNSFLAATQIDQAKSGFNNLVTACVQCHQAYCTGPIPTIKKLYLPEDE